jgi:myo-inositol-1(or 4)-monophosphatase
LQEELLGVAREAAAAAAEVHRNHAGGVGVERWDEKGVADFVTDVDREAEARIVARIRRSFPDHAILAEEAASAPGAPDAAAAGAEYLWVVDPLDGTTNFLHGYPMYAVSIAVVRSGEPVAAVVCGTATDEVWYASAGGGAFHQGQRIRVSTIDTLPRALIGTGFPFKVLERMDEYTTQFRRVLERTAGVRRAGAASLDLCHVASGYFDGFWELSLAPWDFAAGALIVREAGGVVSRMDGRPLDVRRGGSVLAGNPAIHAALSVLLESAALSAAEVAHG